MSSMDMRFPGRSDMLGTLAAADKVDVHALIQQLKMTVFKRRLRLREFFKDFDALRAGYVTDAKFRTALDVAGLALNDPQLTALTAHFVDPSDPKRVKYEAFLDMIDSVFTTAGMETDPASTVSDFTPALQRQTVELTGAAALKCDALLAKLSHIVRTRQMLIKPTFEQYYKNVNSPIIVDHVTKVQFRNALATLELPVSADEADLLTAKFAGKEAGYVDYVAFCTAVDESERTFSMREPRSWVDQPLSSGFRSAPYHLEPGAQPGRQPASANQPKLPVSYPASPELEALLKTLQEKAVQHRLRIADFFIDLDKHADGTITQPQFIKRLCIAYDKIGVGLSEGEVQLLLAAYGKPMVHGATHVQWRKFVADIEKVFTTVGMERDPALMPTYTNTQQKPVTLLPAAREEAVQRLIGELRKRVEVRRVLVKPLFNDFQESPSNQTPVDHITRQQMVQALSRFGIELTADQQRLLHERYDTLGLGTVNFVALVRDIDAYESFSSRDQMRHVFPQDPDFGAKPMMNSGFWSDRVVPGPVLNVQSGRPPTSNDQPALGPSSSASLPAILEKLQRATIANRLRIEDSFKDFDRHRDGTITLNQFLSACALTWSKFVPLSQAETETLVHTYQADKSGQTFVRWSAFIKDVNAAFVATDLEKRPLAFPPPLVPVFARPRAPLGEAEEAQAASVLSRLREICMQRRILVIPFFKDAEYNRRSSRVVDHVTKTQFAQCVKRLDIDLSDDEVNLLARKYDDRQDGNVNYVQFAAAVDPEEKGSDREAPPRARFTGGFKAAKTGAVQPGRAPVVGDVPGLLSMRSSSTKLGDVMRRLQEKVIMFNIPIKDFFVDYDRHRLGAISSAQFRRGLNAAFGEKYILESLTEAEMGLIESTYAREMLDGEYFVDWKEFCVDINAALYTPSLETQPLAVPQPVVPQLGHQLPKLSAADETRIAELLSQMRARFSIRSVYVKAPFHDFAKSANSPVMVDHCTRQQFVQALSRLGVELSPQQSALLFRKYDDAGNGSINYVAFSTDVDPTETFSTRERTAHSAVPPNSFYGGFRQPKVHEELLRQMRS